MSTSPIRRAIAALTGVAASSVLALSSLSAQCGVDEVHTLLQGDPTGGAGFGAVVALSGARALVGAPGDNGYAGAAYFFRFDGSQWVEDLKVTDANGGRFGAAVALDGDVALVTAYQQNSSQGAAVVYRHDGSQWQYEQTLTASDGANGDAFGYECDLRGDLAVVGASNSGGGGAVYVFRHDGTQWNEEQKLVSSDLRAKGYFANCAVEGNTILVGARRNDTVAPDAGRAYVFEYDGVQWNEVQILSPASATAGDFFGNAVALEGDLAVIGAFSKYTSANYAGAGYVYRYDGNQWNEEGYLAASDGGYLHQFGMAVDIQGDHVVVGAPGWDPVSYGTGAAYVFRWDGSRWLEGWKLTPTTAAAGDFIGSGVALDGGTALVGAIYGPAGGVVGAGACTAHPVDELALDANAASYTVGSPLLLTTCGGLQSALTLLAAVDVSGIPVFYKLDLGGFDAAGQRAFGGPVPPGLGGLTIQFLSLGFTQPGALGPSNLVSVSFL